MERKYESFKVVVNGQMPKRRETEEGGRNLLNKLLASGKKAWLYGIWFENGLYNEKLISGTKVYHPVHEVRGSKTVLAENVEWR